MWAPPTPARTYRPWTRRMGRLGLRSDVVTNVGEMPVFLTESKKPRQNCSPLPRHLRDTQSSVIPQRWMKRRVISFGQARTFFQGGLDSPSCSLEKRRATTPNGKNQRFIQGFSSPRRRRRIFSLCAYTTSAAMSSENQRLPQLPWMRNRSGSAVTRTREPADT